MMKKEVISPFNIWTTTSKRDITVYDTRTVNVLVCREREREIRE
jgi:hypothetical protein